MTLLPWIVGSGVAALVVIVAWSWRRSPSHRRCPQCGAETAPVTLAPAQRPVGRWMQARWCGHCGWEGLGRRGPDFDPAAGPAAHESGFRWNGRPERRSRPRFEWATPADPDTTPDSAHPSGFRWAETEAAAEADSAPSAHPSGFRWGGGTESAGEAEPGGFRWGPERPRESRQSGFTWKSKD